MPAPPDRRAHPAPPPLEAPGPSVTPPALPRSDTERREWAEIAKPDGERLAEQTDDPWEVLVAQEESAAGAEAGEIGGVQLPDVPPEKPWKKSQLKKRSSAMEPVYEAGGGEQDGWEATERDLIEAAEWAGAPNDPIQDALAPELESDRSPAEYGEADDVRSTSKDV